MTTKVQWVEGIKLNGCHVFIFRSSKSIKLRWTVISKKHIEISRTTTEKIT